jgi:hypothetical protein
MILRRSGSKCEYLDPQATKRPTDGFTGAFYKACWHVIKPDKVMPLINNFDSLLAANLHGFNSVSIALMPK